MSTNKLLHRLVVLITMVSPIAGQVATPSTAPRGQLVDVGGYRLHLHCTGKGSPTVVFENGSADFSFVWDLVQPDVSKFTRACSYDRAGSAWSDPGPMPRSFEQINLELHTALQRASIRGPYVLVGQSYGGFLVRAFAEKYKSEVVGLVLVDAAHENERIMMQDKVVRIRDMAKGGTLPPPRLQLNDAETKQYAELRQKPTEAGPTAVEPPLDKLSTEDQKAELWAIVQPFLPIAVGSELDSSQEEIAVWYSAKKLSTTPLGDVPLVVISRGEGGYPDTPEVSGKQLDQERREEQAELTYLSHNSKQIIAEHSGHNVHLEDPKLVVQAIHEVVDTARGKGKLAVGQ
jgi:pimeloyl-ACP methyl ester carboxylesterase